MENEKDFSIYTIIKIANWCGYGGALLLFILASVCNMNLIFLSLLFLILTPILNIILNSYLKKQNKEIQITNYRNSLKKNGMNIYKSIQFENIVEVDVDTDSKLIGVYSYYESESSVLKYSEILDFEVIENGNSVVSSRTGSAVVGGLLFGGLGAIAGASGSRTIDSNSSTLKLKIYTNNISNSVITLDFLDSTISKNNSSYDELTDIINKIISFLKIAREENRQNERKEDKKVVIENKEEIKSNSNLSSLKELAELKEKGIITEEEFNNSKKKILKNL